VQHPLVHVDVGGPDDEEAAVVEMVEVAEQHEHDPIRVIDDLRLGQDGKPECWLWHLECYDCGQTVDYDQVEEQEGAA
jgi:hypothetical protein